MFAAILIHAGPNLAAPYSPAHLRALAQASNCLQIVRDLDAIPHEHELRRHLNLTAPAVVILNLMAPGAMDVAALVRRIHPSSAIFGYAASFEHAQLAHQYGINGVVQATSDANVFRTALQQAIQHQKGGIESNLFLFLPSKAGSGASTLAVNTAVSLARDHAKRVLLIDSDLRSGILAVMLGITSRRSTEYVLQSIHELDHLQLKDCMGKTDGVDCLLSSHTLDTNPPEWQDYNQLLTLIRGHYDAVIVDMPELINPATIELVRRAQDIFLVSTPEIPAMTMAKQRLSELKRLEIPVERTKLLLNRWHKSDPSPKEISALIGHQVHQTFPNDYAAVRAAILSSRPVSPHSRLGRSYSEFAGNLLPKTAPQAQSFSGLLKNLFGAGSPA
jgi:pilus assembly protein CpaE